jgi:uncharacterized protein (DUF302 family)
MDYGYRGEIKDVSMEEARERVVAALKEEGFGVLTEIDVQTTLKKKIDADFRPYIILGACNPKLAHQALQAEPELGLLLPCNVVLQQSDASSVQVSAVRPDAMFSVVDNDELGSVAGDVGASLERVIQAVSA